MQTKIRSCLSAILLTLLVSTSPVRAENIVVMTDFEDFGDLREFAKNAAKDSCDRRGGGTPHYFFKGLTTEDLEAYWSTQKELLFDLHVNITKPGSHERIIGAMEAMLGKDPDFFPMLLGVNSASDRRLISGTFSRYFINKTDLGAMHIFLLSEFECRKQERKRAGEGNLKSFSGQVPDLSNGQEESRGGLKPENILFMADRENLDNAREFSFNVATQLCSKSGGGIPGYQLIEIEVAGNLDVYRQVSGNDRRSYLSFSLFADLKSALGLRSTRIVKENLLATVGKIGERNSFSPVFEDASKGGDAVELDLISSAFTDYFETAEKYNGKGSYIDFKPKVLFFRFSNFNCFKSHVRPPSSNLNLEARLGSERDFIREVYDLLLMVDDETELDSLVKTAADAICYQYKGTAVSSSTTRANSFKHFQDSDGKGLKLFRLFSNLARNATSRILDYGRIEGTVSTSNFPYESFERKVDHNRDQIIYDAFRSYASYLAGESATRTKPKQVIYKFSKLICRTQLDF